MISYECAMWTHAATLDDLAYSHKLGARWRLCSGSESHGNLQMINIMMQ